MTARLLHFRISHYNEKVRWALDHKKWPHVRQTLLPGFHLLRARRTSGQSKLPILILDEGGAREVLYGSAHILEELERRRPEPALFPSDPADRERARVLEAYFDDEVAPALRRLFWSTYLDSPRACAEMATAGATRFTRGLWRVAFPLMRPIMRRNMGVDTERLATAHARLGTYVDRIEAELGPHGYLVGDRFSVADLAVSAVMTAILRPPQFPYPLPDPWPDALVELRATIAERPGSKWVLEMYARHRDPSAEIALTSG